MNLPKKYLSYSAMRLWIENKEQYRDRYYRGIESPPSKYMFFGKEIAKGLEDKTIVIPGLPLYPVAEYQIKLDVEGVPFFAYLDQYDPDRFKFRETKTGVMKPNGAPRWTQEDVNNHMQLDVYSLLIELKHGAIDEECHLDWLHTRPKMKYVEMEGHMLESVSREMELTGEVTTFTRIISGNERDRMKMLIRSVAEEISSDYTRFLKVGESPTPS